MSSDAVSIGLMLFFLGLGLLIIWGAWRVSLRTQQLEQTGKTMEAKVTKLSSSGSGRSRSHRVAYHADLNKLDGTSEAIDKEEHISSRTYLSLTEGGSIWIAYAPDNPQGTAQLASSYGENSFWSLASVGIGFAGTALFIMILMLSNSAQVASRNAPTAAASTLAATNLIPIRNALTPHFSSWQALATDDKPHKLTSAEADLDPSLNIAEIDYGLCTAGGFYVYALKALQPGRVENSSYSDAYYYATKPQTIASLELCKPNDWLVEQKADLGSGWGFGMVFILPPSTATPVPIGR